MIFAYPLVCSVGDSVNPNAPADYHIIAVLGVRTKTNVSLAAHVKIIIFIRVADWLVQLCGASDDRSCCRWNVTAPIIIVSSPSAPLLHVYIFIRLQIALGLEASLSLSSASRCARVERV